MKAQALVDPGTCRLNPESLQQNPQSSVPNMPEIQFSVNVMYH